MKEVFNEEKNKDSKKIYQLNDNDNDNDNIDLLIKPLLPNKRNKNFSKF